MNSHVNRPLKLQKFKYSINCLNYFSCNYQPLRYLGQFIEVFQIIYLLHENSTLKFMTPATIIEIFLESTLCVLDACVYNLKIKAWIFAVNCIQICMYVNNKLVSTKEHPHGAPALRVVSTQNCQNISNKELSKYEKPTASMALSIFFYNRSSYPRR